MNDIEQEPPASEQPEELAEPVSSENAVDAGKPQSVARSAGIVSIAVMFSRVLGLVREQVFAHYFSSHSAFRMFCATYLPKELFRQRS